MVTCSHFAIESRRRPPSPAGMSTWVGAGRSIVERGTTMTSLAHRLRASIETTSAGRRFRSSGWPGSLTRYSSPRCGKGSGSAYSSQNRLEARPESLVHARSSRRSAAL
ncbi:MAG: hypothetical protein FD131_4808 [Rhodocyclaceae bacterium]|nr:MAG: hypothetical protein FD131_4808 [Rhodocyclaceae bacterium]